MPQVIQAKCPHCQRPLRMPTEWLGQAMRCKHCKQIFQVTPRAAVAPSAAAAAAPPVAPPVHPGGRLPAAQVVPGHGDPFAFDEASGADGTLPVYRRRRGSRLKGLVVGVVVLGVVTAGAILGWSQIKDRFGKHARGPTDKEPTQLAQGTSKGNPPPRSEPDDTAPGSKPEKKSPATGKEKRPKGGDKNPPTVKEKVPPRTEPAPKTKPETKVKPGPPGAKFPRRALAISVSEYWLANPLGYGRSQDAGYPGSSTFAILKALGNFHLKFPNTQLTELSDQGFNPRPPLKSVIEGTITDFLASCREQDRIVLLFAGHATADGKEAFLVPVLGDLKDTQTLIRLKWVYEQLKSCKARQKLLILDVCRFDPARGHERPGSEKMSKVLDAELQTPPEGVQVWSSCVLDQNAYETESGSVFLQALCAAMQERLPGFQEPGMPLPLDVLVPRVNKHMVRVLAPLKLDQVSRLTGQEKAGGAPYNPAEPLPKELVVRQPPMPAGDAASAGVVKRILDEIAMVPPPRAGRPGVQDSLTVKALPPFAAKDLEKFDSDYKSWLEFENKEKDFPLRSAVVKAAKAIQESTSKFTMKEFFGGATTAAVKKAVFKEQLAPGETILNLEEALDELLKAGEARRKEKSKRWQANFDYVMARLKSRLIYVYEYNNVLAQIRGDSLPPLEDGFSGYRLGARKKITITESKVKAWAKDVEKTWQKIINDYPSTPWALIARRERLTVLGLEWRPSRE
jgi:hypothetical protein